MENVHVVVRRSPQWGERNLRVLADTIRTQEGMKLIVLAESGELHSWSGGNLVVIYPVIGANNSEWWGPSNPPDWIGPGVRVARYIGISVNRGLEADSILSLLNQTSIVPSVNGVL